MFIISKLFQHRALHFFIIEQAGAIRQEKDIKVIKVDKEFKLSLFANGILYKGITKILPKTPTNNNQFSNVTVYRINFHKSIDFYTAPTDIQRKRSWTHSHSQLLLGK